MGGPHGSTLGYQQEVLFAWAPALVSQGEGEGLPKETTRCGHGKVPPTFDRNMEFPAFNHFLSNCHLGADQSRTDTGSPLGNSIWGTEFQLEAGIPGAQPQQALRMMGRLLEASGARRPPCQSPKHFQIQCSMPSTKPVVNVTVVAWMRKPSKRSCVLCSRSRWRGRPQCVLTLRALQAHWEDESDPPSPRRGWAGAPALAGASGCGNSVFPGSSPLG